MLSRVLHLIYLLNRSAIIVGVVAVNMGLNPALSLVLTCLELQHLLVNQIINYFDSVKFFFITRYIARHTQSVSSFLLVL